MSSRRVDKKTGHARIYSKDYNAPVERELSNCITNIIHTFYQYLK